jgi:hypothetical protein
MHFNSSVITGYNIIVKGIKTEERNERKIEERLYLEEKFLSP